MEVEVVVARVDVATHALHECARDVGTARNRVDRVVLGDDLRRLLEVRPGRKVL
jgi:hypothetical protein